MATCQTGADIAVYTAPLAALPPGVTLPGYVIYNSGTLSTAGHLSANEKPYFLKHSSDPGYQAAISSLYTASQADITKGTPSDIALACEYKISQAECKILTGKDFSGQARLRRRRSTIASLILQVTNPKPPPGRRTSPR